MKELLIQQELKWEEGKRIYGCMLINVDDASFKEEIGKTGYGFLDFSYDVENNHFLLEKTNAPDTVSRYSSQIISELWRKVKMVMNHWSSDEYLRYTNARERVRKSTE